MPIYKQYSTPALITTNDHSMQVTNKYSNQYMSKPRWHSPDLRWCSAWPQDIHPSAEWGIVVEGVQPCYRQHTLKFSEQLKTIPQFILIKQYRISLLTCWTHIMTTKLPQCSINWKERSSTLACHHQPHYVQIRQNQFKTKNIAFSFNVC